MRRLAPVLCVLLSAVPTLLLVGRAAAQDPPAVANPTADLFKVARDRLFEGNQELAAERLIEFLAAKPTPQDYLNLQQRYGATVFQALRNVPRWFPDAKRDAEFKKATLETIITESIAASDKFIKDPNRIAKFVRNLGASREEREFAVAELRRSGDLVVPAIIDQLRSNNSVDFQAGVRQAILQLDSIIIPGLIVAAEHVSDDLKLLIIGAIGKRNDLLTLEGRIDSNPAPLVWYLSGSPAGISSPVRAASAELIRRLTSDNIDRIVPAAELTRYAESLYTHNSLFLKRFQDPNMEKVLVDKVRLWTWDETKKNVTVADVAIREAEEKLGLKFLRWAIELNPNFEPAQQLFILTATQRGVERANFRDLSKNEPGLYALLASAPTNVLIELLESAIGEKNTPVVYGLSVALADRGDRLAATPTIRFGQEDKPRQPVLVQSLKYPDPRVQLAAAVGLVNMPENVQHGSNALIVDVLRRAVGGAEPAEAPVAPPAAIPVKTSKISPSGRAIIADSVSTRGDELAGYLHEMGFQTEYVSSGRGLIQRMNEAANFDLILIDRNIVQPQLTDLISIVQADSANAGRAIVVVASGNQRVDLGLEPLLLRLALMIAATDTPSVDVPAPIIVDKRKPDDETARLRRENYAERDKALQLIAAARLKRMNRIVDASHILDTPQLGSRLALRLPQLTLAVLVAEYNPTEDSAPTIFRDLNNYTRLLQRQSDLEASVEKVSTAPLVLLVSQLEKALNPEISEKFETIRRRVDSGALGLVDHASVDNAEQLLATTAKQLSQVPNIKVIREPFAVVGFEDDIKAILNQPGQMPRDPVERKSSMALAAATLARLAGNQRLNYDVKPAVAALRQAMVNDELAPSAITALEQISTADAQLGLVATSITAAHPTEIRLKSADAAIRHVQHFGNLTQPEAVKLLLTRSTNESDLTLKSKLTLLHQLLSPKAPSLAARILDYKIPAPPAPAAAMPAKPDAIPAKPAGEAVPPPA